jgi:hypothetical protein
VLALFAEPGAVVIETTPSGWQLALGAPVDGLHGWAALAAGVGVPPVAAAFIVAVLLAPLAGLALLALFVPGSKRSIPAMGIALLGFVTAVAGVHLELSHLGDLTTSVWAGAALSLSWLGLAGAAVVALEALGTAVAVPGLLAAIGAAVVALPLLAAPFIGASAVHGSNGRLLPAVVTAAASTNPSIGTLELHAQRDGSFAAELHRGVGTTLDEQSTIAATTTVLREAQDELAVLAGNLVTRSGYDVDTELQQRQIGFVLLPEAEPGAATAARLDAADALDSNATLVAVGETSNGFLWRFAAFEADPSLVAEPDVAALRTATLLATGTVFGIALLLAIPTGIRRRPVAESDEENPADTFEEDESV